MKTETQSMEASAKKRIKQVAAMGRTINFKPTKELQRKPELKIGKKQP
jgi:hypothetical protein